MRQIKDLDTANALIGNLCLTLQGIAEFPVTDPKNMDAINMKQIAQDMLDLVKE